MSNLREGPRKPAQTFWTSETTRRILKRVVDARNEEVEPLVKGFASLFCVLSAYFILLPVRDEAGVSLGTGALPILFCLSLLATVVCTPLTAAFLIRANVPREKALRQLFTILAASFVVFFVLYITFGSNSPASSEKQVQAASFRRDAGKEIGWSGKEVRKQASSKQGDTESEAAKRLRSEESSDAPAGAQPLTHAQVLVRAAFYLWLTAVNLVALSTVWARIADVIGSGASKRLFGFLAAGATCGQLVGSLLASLFARLLKAGARGGAPAAHIQAFPMLLTALLLEAAGLSVASLRPLQPSSPGKMPSSTRQKGRRPESLKLKLWNGVSRLWDGFSSIRASQYLSKLTLYIILNTTISATMYILKSMVVASAAADSASRMAIFATINSVSAFVIAALQLFATGFLLTHLKLPTALAASAIFAAGLMAVISVQPSAAVVGGGEVIRKVLNYVLTRPARETLFTVVSPDEMYKAKIFIDTVIVRLGDTVAAGLFQLFEGVLHLGPSGCAVAAIPVCLACAALAHLVGVHHEQLAAKQGRVEVS